MAIEIRVFFPIDFNDELNSCWGDVREIDVAHTARIAVEPQRYEVADFGETANSVARREPEPA